MRVSTDPRDPTTDPPPSSPSQEASQLQRDHVLNTNLTPERVSQDPSSRMEIGLAMTDTMGAAASTPAEQMAGFFKQNYPIVKESLAQDACKLPRGMRGDTPRQIKKNKDIHTKGTGFLFHLLKFQEIKGFIKDDDETKSTLPTKSAQGICYQIIIYVNYFRQN